MSIPSPDISNAIQHNYQQWRERFLSIILYAVAALGLVAVIAYILSSGSVIYKLVAGFLYCIFLLFTFIKMPYVFRAGFFLLLIYAVALSALLDTAISSGGSLFFLGWIVLSALIISPRIGWITTGISLTTIAATSGLFLSGHITPWTASSQIGTIGQWLQVCAYIFFLAITIVRGIDLIQQEFIKAQYTAGSALQGLREEQAGLSARIVEATAVLNQRTLELESANRNNARRAQQFEAISQVLSSVVSLRSMDKLLPSLSQAISEQFTFYHVGIFLNDQENQYAVLSAANSPGGKVMLARNHRLKIGEQGMVGYVSQTGLPRIALDVGVDAVFFDNPDLADTRSEMTLPLKIGGKVVGALDIQSTESSAFNEEDVRILTALANQVSLAIDNARLFEQTSHSLAEAEALYRQYLREGWSRLASEDKFAGFRYTRSGILPLTDSIMTEKEQESERVEVPILLRGERVGSLIIQTVEERPLSEDQMDIARAVADRVALSAENARLFDEVSRRAERERTVSQITTNIRSTTDPQFMVQTALDELKRVLGVEEIKIRPYSLENLSPEGSHPALHGKQQKQTGTQTEPL